MSTAALGARAVREVLERHRVIPARSLGQNFVVDPNTVRKVVALASLDGTERVLEIGAGAGSLTVALAHAAREVAAVERDRRLLPVLHETLAGLDNVEVVHGDALRMDLAVYGATTVVANLPYNIATPLVLKILADAPAIATLTVMTQAEAGARLAARPGSRVYGQPSVIAAYDAATDVVATVARRAFYPVPRVDSVVVRVVRRPGHRDVDRSELVRVVRAAFGQRRKKLRNALAPLAGSAEEARAVLGAAGLDPDVRAESVALEGYLALAQRLARTQS